MKKLVVVLGMGLGLALLLLPGGCALSLAVAGGAISAATTDPACLSEETSDRLSCAPNFAGSAGVPDALIDSASILAPDLWAAAAVQSAIDAVGRQGRYIAEGNGPDALLAAVPHLLGFPVRNSVQLSPPIRPVWPESLAAQPLDHPWRDHDRHKLLP